MKKFQGMMNLKKGLKKAKFVPSKETDKSPSVTTIEGEMQKSPASTEEQIRQLQKTKEYEMAQEQEWAEDESSSSHAEDYIQSVLGTKKKKDDDEE